MKISNSKKQLAKIIHENGGWRDGEFAAQDGDGGVGVYEIKPEWNSLAKYWWRGAWVEWFLANKIKNHHQTVLSRAEYFHLYPAPDANGWIEWNGGECPVDGNEIIDIRYPESREEFGAKAKFRRWNHARNKGDIIAYRLHKPEKSLEELCGEVKEENKHEHVEAKPTIEQLAADYRNAKDYADRKQQEADAAKADAEAKLAELVAAGKALGLALSVTGAESEPELAIIDWRDLRVGDEVECVSYEGEHRFGSVEDIDKFSMSQQVYVRHANGSASWPTHWRFIRRP
jgi:hypothetical protein